MVQVPEGVTEMGYAAFEARSLGYTNHLTIYAPAGSLRRKVCKRIQDPLRGGVRGGIEMISHIKR